MGSVAGSSSVVSDPTRDLRHREAKAARDQADWLAWLDLGGTAPRTLYDYEWATARGLRLYPETAFDEFTSSDLAHILRTFPPRGRRPRKYAYSSWFNWGYKIDGRLPLNPMDKLPVIARPQQKVIDVFTDAEIAELTCLPDNDGDLFLILFDTGLRRSEARNLHVRDCQLERRQLVVRAGKGGKGRIVPLTQRLTEALATWFLLDALRPTDYLWPVRPGGYGLRRTLPMGDTSFITWYRRCLETAMVPYRNPHTTRHTFATRWLRRGGRLETLSRAMGHASIRTTFDQYGHLDNADIAADLARVEGIQV